MIKYYCNICDKEVNKSPNDFQRIIVPSMFNGIVRNSEEEWHMCNKCAMEWYGMFIKFKTATKRIDQIKPADVQPIKHGRWSECYTDSRLYSGICTVCGKASIRSIKENPLEYCPKCGARMDGAQNENIKEENSNE